MTCPNCGLANPDNARFCGNCGTTLGAAPYNAPPPPPQPPYGTVPGLPGAAPQRSMGQKIGLGCLLALLIFFLFGLSCTRACFRPRRYYRRSGSLVRTVNQHSTLSAVLSTKAVERTVRRISRDDAHGVEISGIRTISRSGGHGSDDFGRETGAELHRTA